VIIASRIFANVLLLSACLVLFFWCSVEEAYAKTAFRLFGTIEFRAKKEKIPAWMEVLDKQARSDFFPAARKWRGSYADFKKKYNSLDNLKEQLHLVNMHWNQYPYVDDYNNVYKMEDYWAIPSEMVVNSGDCEDYAIAKFYTLKDLGFPTDKMRIVVVHEMIRDIAHAVLAVYVEDDILILDNLSNRVFSHSILKNYDPRFSLNEEWRWVHMRPKKK